MIAAPCGSRGSIAVSTTMTTGQRKPLGKLITKETVRCCTPEIIRYTNLRSLVPFLCAERLLTDDEFAELLNEKQPGHQRKLRLVEILKTKGPDWPQHYVICLEKASDHKGHAYILEVLQQQAARDEPRALHSTRRFGRSTSRSESDDTGDTVTDSALQYSESQPKRTTRDETQLPRALSKVRRDFKSLSGVEERSTPGTAAGLLFVSTQYQPCIKTAEPSVDMEILQKEVRELQQQQVQLGKDYKQLERALKHEFQELKEFLAQKLPEANPQPECQHCDVLKELKKRECLLQQLTEKNQSLEEQVQRMQRRSRAINKEEVDIQQHLKTGKTVKFDWHPNPDDKLAGGGLRLHLSGDKTRVYACGGVSNCSDSPNKYVHVFCLHRRKWQKPYPTNVVSYGSAIVNGKLALIGGLKANGNREFATSVSLLNEEAEMSSEPFYVDDNELPPILTKRWAPAVVVCNNKLIVAGGYDVNDSTLDLVEVLDLTDKQWVKAAKLPLCLGAASCISVGGHIYILGGYNSAKGGWLSSTYRCKADRLTDNSSSEMKPEFIETWNQIESMPLASVAALTFGEHVVTVGGINGEKDPSDKMFLFTDEGTWKEIGNIPRARFSCSGLILPSSQLMVVGGQKNRTDLLAGHVEVAALNISGPPH